VAYAGAALIGSAVPAHPGWTQAEEGVRVYVIDNGVHTDLVLPTADFADLLRPGHLADPAQAAQSHVTFGWGDRDFYLNTPSWREMNPLRALRALVGGGETVLHVSYIPEPRVGRRVRAVTLRPDEYYRLTAYVRASFAGGAPVRGYGGHDAFYPARGGYSAVSTCNEWTAQGLRVAGIRMGAWTPFAFGVMQWL
jgi:uncharacterized protein (TIGR02117 family)